MNFALSTKVDQDKVFVARKSECGTRWDPHYHQPLYADLDSNLTRIGAVSVSSMAYKIFSGITPLSGGDSYSDSLDAVAFVRSGDFNEDGSIDQNKLIRLKPEIHNALMRRSKLAPGDVLFAIVGATIGKVGMFPGGYEANINQAVCAVRFPSDILPAYVHAFFLTPLGQQQIERIKRPVARANINLAEIGSLRLPALAISDQQKVVEALDDAFAKKRKTEAEALSLLEQIDHTVLGHLGIQQMSIPTKDLKDRIACRKAHEVTGRRWDPNYSRFMHRFLKEVAFCPFPIHRLRDFVAAVQYGISERADEDVVGVPMLRMLNLQEGEWDLSAMKYIAMSDLERRPYLLKRGDILFNRTNSKELVGKCNVFDFEGEYVFASYLMRVRIKDELALRPGYVVAYLGSSLGRIQIDAVSRQIAGMTNINAEELRDLLIPLPPPHIQDQICGRVMEIRQMAAALRAQATRELGLAKKDIETLILSRRQAIEAQRRS